MKKVLNIATSRNKKLEVEEIIALQVAGHAHCPTDIRNATCQSRTMNYQLTAALYDQFQFLGFFFFFFPLLFVYREKKFYALLSI